VPVRARALIERWGGDGELEARLRRIDPAAFTRVSALGIEEQRVRLRLDLLTPPEARRGLGEGYRVHVRLILWDADAIIRVPQAALFRHADDWAVFVEDSGKARLQPVRIGRQAGGQVQVGGTLLGTKGTEFGDIHEMLAVLATIVVLSCLCNPVAQHRSAGRSALSSLKQKPSYG
jgi:multidrug efflux pump subunit AcrA (membrane-fusion protein)